MTPTESSRTEDFFSSPHLFIYTTHFLATLALARIAFTPELRVHFGRPMRMPILGEMPAALRLLYGVTAGAVWPSGPIPVLTAAPAMSVGAPLGSTVADIVRSPDVRLWRVLAIVGVGLPAVTGAVDLFLRSRTP